MRSVLALAVWTSSLGLPALPARADPAPPPAARSAPRATEPTRMVTDDCARARKADKTCELTLPPEDVAGAAARPDDIALRLLRFAPAGSLIHFRRDFIPEIVKSAEDR
jgi:hypothetical protein